MNEDAARAIDICFAIAYALITAIILYNAAVKAEPFALKAVRYFKEGTQ